MLIIVNALKSISRSKGRNILIGIIVLTVAVSGCVALAIGNAAEEAKASALAELKITASITRDIQSLMPANGFSPGGRNNGGGGIDLRSLLEDYPELTLAQLQEYANSDHVEDFIYSATAGMNTAGDIEPFTTDTTDSTDSTDGSDAEGDNSGFGSRPGGTMVISGFSLGDVNLGGYSSESAMTKFIDGTCQITDGEMFDIASDARDCLVSTLFAAYNGLATGDTITLTNPGNEEETYEFTIVGIYTETASEEQTNFIQFSTSMDPANMIYTSYLALNSIIEASKADPITVENQMGREMTSEMNGALTTRYVFAGAEDYYAFEAELRDKGLDPIYILNSQDINNVNSAMVPLENLKNFAGTLLWIILAVGAVVLVVINMFNIRERKFEVGVLTAIGIRKEKVALQFVTELLCVTLAAILIGSAAGAAVSVPVATKLLEQQVEAQEAKAAEQQNSFGRPVAIGGGSIITGTGSSGLNTFMGYGDVDYIDQVNAVISPLVLGQLILIGLALTIVSSFAAVVFVLRYEPLRILTDRS